jgi:hypothetical protein
MDNLSNACFAYPLLKKYPVHTKEATIVSYEEFNSDRDKYTPLTVQNIESVFEKAASYHDLDLTSLVKEASSAPEVVSFTGGGVTINMSKIASVDDIEEATDYLLTKRAQLSWKAVKDAAKYVYHNAANSTLDIEDPTMVKLARLAGVGVGDREEIEEEFCKRASDLALSTDSRETFFNYFNELEKLSDEEFYKEANLNNICGAMEDIDKLTGNDYNYWRTVETPENVCFKNTVVDLLKQASDLLTIPSIDTTISKKALLERKEAVKSFFSSALNEELPSEDDKLFEKVASLAEIPANMLLDAVK